MKLTNSGETNLRSLLTQRNIDYLIALIAFLLGLYLNWTILESVFLSFFIWIVLNPIPSRYLAYPVLGSMLLLPFLLVQHKEKTADEVAVYGFYLLVMAVVMGIFEIVNLNKTIKNN